MNEHVKAGDDFSLETLDFGGVLELLRPFLSSRISEPPLREIRPCVEREILLEDFERVREALDFLQKSERPNWASLSDPRELVERLAVEGVVLEAPEILILLGLMRAADEAREQFCAGPLVRLGALAALLPDFHAVRRGMDGKILPDGALDDSASPELARIRRRFEQAERELRIELQRVLARLTAEAAVRSDVITLRNDRFVIPVVAEAKRRVAGVVHGASASAETLFIEPLETVPLNNELVELHEREEREIQRILAAWSQTLRERAGDLDRAAEMLSALDLIFAKALFARAYDACLPTFVSVRSLRLREVRHPLLQSSLRAEGRSPVPLDLELIEPHTQMIISGPNTGGKTVALKAIGVAALMAQSGIPVTAAEAQMPLFGRVLADIGDPQSLADNLSTFSGHVKHLQSMLDCADANDLVLLDEMGASTEPNEGAALAVAALEAFCACGPMTVITTHHSRLKTYAAETKQAVNAAMEFDEQSLQPTYRVQIGIPGKSSAIEIAARLGLDLKVVERARALMGASERDAAALIRSLHETREAMERQQAQMRENERARVSEHQKQFAEFERERRAKLKELDARLEDSIRQSERRWEEMLAQALAKEPAKKRDIQARFVRRTAAVKRTAREDWNVQTLEWLDAAGGSKDSQRAPAPGDRARVEGFPGEGKVLAMTGDSVEVQIGRMRVKVSPAQVHAIAGKNEIESSRNASLATVSALSEAPAEINVIGATAEEARERVDKFLDEAFVAGRVRLRIVHGHGKGVLRKTLQEMFAKHPQVENFYPAPPQEGGTGATIVELRI